MRLQIQPVIAKAEELQARIQRELPRNDGLAKLAGAVAGAAREAERVSRELRRPLGIHRLPALFLGVALILFVGWVYVTFFRSTTLTVALPDRDAQVLRDRILRDRRVHFRPVVIRGSRECADGVARGAFDLAFIQGGMFIPPDLPRLEIASPEIVLWFLRSSASDAAGVRCILTSVGDEGSHTVAQQFVKAWQIDGQVHFRHEWTQLSENEGYVIPEDVDAVFVVKDPADSRTLVAAQRLAAAGFRLVSPELGARAGNFDFLNPHVVPAGYLRSFPAFPPQAVNTYAVSTYLVARRGLTPRLLGMASRLLDGKSPTISEQGFQPNLSEASEIFQGVEAFLGILINIALAFLALLGLEMLHYRKRFHELNSLISLISVHQSSKDVLGVKDPVLRRNHLHYLTLCSDLLGLISMIAGYYTQENSSLLFNSLPEIIHQRCDGLKINLQLKILHATIELAPGQKPVEAEV